MSSICIVDTSVFCNLLRVPNRSQDYERARRELKQHIQDGDTLLLPMAAIYEAGNHIAQNGDGRQRREAAKRFASQVLQALEGSNPFSPTQIHEADEVRQWLDAFPDQAMRGLGLGDLSIINVYEQQCALNRARRVLIWSYDEHLRAYARDAGL